MPNEHAFRKEKIHPPSTSTNVGEELFVRKKSVRYVGARIVEQFLRLRSACHHQAKQCKKGYNGERTSLNPGSTQLSLPLSFLEHRVDH